jgi:hypothetical protein
LGIIRLIRDSLSDGGSLLLAASSIYLLSDW